MVLCKSTSMKATFRHIVVRIKCTINHVQNQLDKNLRSTKYKPLACPREVKRTIIYLLFISSENNYVSSIDCCPNLNRKFSYYLPSSKFQPEEKYSTLIFPPPPNSLPPLQKKKTFSQH